MNLIDEIQENINRLKVLPNLIAEKVEANNHRDEINGLQSQIKNILIDFEAEAGLQVDDNGKKVYTNVAMRQARAKELAEDDPIYKDSQKRLAELLNVKAQLDIEIDRFRNELYTVKAVLFAQSEMLHYRSVQIEAENKIKTVEVKCV